MLKKQTIVLLLTLLLIALSTNAQSQLVIYLKNPLAFDREDVISLPWNKLKSLYPNIDQYKIVVYNTQTATEVPCQFEYKGEKQIQNLLLYVNILANAECKYEIKEGTPSKFVSKTYCRYVPERKDDFAWENDRIAYRMYGKALEVTNQNAYGIDVWSKYVDYSVIDKWYKLDNYHVDNGEGHDFYKVGLTLGAGDIAPYEKNKIWYPGNYRIWKILDKGPLRLCFQLEYDAWEVAGREVHVIKTISLDAGSQLNKFEVEYRWNDDDPLVLVAGLAKRQDPGIILLNEQQGVMGYWEPPYANSGVIGTACLFTQPTSMFISSNQILGTIKLNKPGKLIYYNGAAWDKAGFIKSSVEWFNYLEKYKLKINNPIQAIIKLE